MSLEIRYEAVNDIYSSIGSNAVRLGQVSLPMAASLGEALIGEMVIDDVEAARTFIGYRAVSIYETSAPSNNQLVWWGRIGQKRVHRGPSFRTGAARQTTVELIEENTALTFRILTDADAKRPRETAGDRIRWLVNESDTLSSTDAHPTYFANPTTQMDAVDYRTQSNLEVLADVANATGYNFWLQWDTARGREILFIDPNGTDYPSTLRISNDLADIDGNQWTTGRTFAPEEDAELTIDPSRVTAGAVVVYDGGYVYRRNGTTQRQFAIVDRVAPLANVKTSATALAIANRYLADNDEEDERVSCSIVVPASQVNDIRHGQWLYAKFTHFPDWEDFRACRVTKRTVNQDEAIGQYAYRIDLELSPGTVVPAVPEPGDHFYVIGAVGSSLTQCGWDGITIDGVYHPEPGGAPPTYDQDPTGLVYYYRTGGSGWNFAFYNGVGSGAIDGDTDYGFGALGNIVIIGPFSAGTDLVIHTVSHPDASRHSDGGLYQIYEIDQPNGYTIIGTVTETAVVGSDYSFTVS